MRSEPDKQKQEMERLRNKLTEKDQVAVPLPVEKGRLDKIAQKRGRMQRHGGRLFRRGDDRSTPAALLH